MSEPLVHELSLIVGCAAQHASTLYIAAAGVVVMFALGLLIGRQK